MSKAISDNVLNIVNVANLCYVHIDVSCLSTFFQWLNVIESVTDETPNTPDTVLYTKLLIHAVHGLPFIHFTLFIHINALLRYMKRQASASIIDHAVHIYGKALFSWWRHQMETFPAFLTLCDGNPSVTGGCPSQWPLTRSFVVFFDVRLNKQLSPQSIYRWFETP